MCYRRFFPRNTTVHILVATRIQLHYISVAFAFASLRLRRVVNNVNEEASRSIVIICIGTRVNGFVEYVRQCSTRLRLHFLLVIPILGLHRLRQRREKIVAAVLDGDEIATVFAWREWKHRIALREFEKRETELVKCGYRTNRRERWDGRGICWRRIRRSQIRGLNWLSELSPTPDLGSSSCYCFPFRFPRFFLLSILLCALMLLLPPGFKTRLGTRTLLLKQ